MTNDHEFDDDASFRADQ